MLDLVVAAAFEDVDEADDIAVGIGSRILDGITHARLGGEMHDAVGFEGPECLLDSLSILEIAPEIGKARMREQALHPGALEADVVIVVEIVDTKDLVATFEQAFGDCRADESGRTRHENLHGLKSSTSPCLGRIANAAARSPVLARADRPRPQAERARSCRKGRLPGVQLRRLS